MAFSDYSSTPASNSTIGGLSIGENCPPSNINNAIRQLMADAKSFSMTVPTADTYMPKAGGGFTGGIWLSGAGAYRYNANLLSSGATHFQATGTERPPAAEGVVVYYY